MKTLKNTDIEHIDAGSLSPGMVLPGGIIKEITISGGRLYIEFFGGNTGFIRENGATNVIARIDSALLANMMGA